MLTKKDDRLLFGSVSKNNARNRKYINIFKKYSTCYATGFDKLQKIMNKKKMVVKMKYVILEK